MKDVVSYAELRALQKALSTHYSPALKAIMHCARTPIPAGPATGVFVFRNEYEAKFLGLAHCDNAWACPVCSANKMLEVRRKISLALDNLNEKACMITLTMPHLRFFPLRDMIDILFEAWRKFKANGTTALRNIMNKVQTKYYVRVAEVTYGKNGWHPHFHMLIWAKNIQEFGKAEAHLRKKWNEIIRRVTIKKLKDKFPQIESVLDRMEKHADPVSHGLFVSREENGSVRRILSADYIAGWGGDTELTGLNLKSAHEDNITVHELMKQIIENPSEENIKLYAEFIAATRHKQRFNFSRALLNKIKQFEISVKTKEILYQKKNLELVCWFTYEQWSEICSYTHMCTNILYLAHHHPHLLKDFLTPYNWWNDFIHPMANLWQQCFEDKIERMTAA